MLTCRSQQVHELYGMIPFAYSYIVKICLRNFTVIAFIFTLQTTYAQHKQPLRFEIEADPLAYLLKGYSVHAGVTYGKLRSSVGVFGIEQPSFFLNNDAFSVFGSGFDVKTDYLFSNVKGWHTGIQLTFGRDKIKLKETGSEEKLWGTNIGLRAGYRLMFGKPENQYKGLYINPWVALIYAPGAEYVVIGNKLYKQSQFTPFPAIHVGWRF